jgi:hypothetical protein
MPNTVQANKLINQAADLYAVGVQYASQYEAYVGRRDQQVTAPILLLDDKHKALAQPIKDMNAKIKQANETALKQDLLQAGVLLDEVLVQLTQCKRVVADSEACARRIKVLKETTVPGLTTHTPAAQDPVIGNTIKSLSQDITKVEQLIKDLKYTEALKQLDAMETVATSAALKKKVKAGGLNATQLTDQCKALLTQPGGAVALDELVSSLRNDNAVDAVLAAMKARFKLDDASCLGSGTDAVKTKELCKLYEVMTTVPEKHTRDNPSLKKITRRNSTEGSDYSGTEKAINMGEGHPDTSSPYVVAKPDELPDIDPKCVPKTGGKQPKYFDWNTLHEIGHAMDDKKQFMKKNGSQSAYGGWAEHGGDVLAVAKAAVDEFALPGITAVMVAKYLDSLVEPTGLSATTTPKLADWNQLKDWADRACYIENRYTCMDGTACGKSAKNGGFKLGDRVYYESYDGQWFSYEAAARKQGITGYQFRAPGEWFSELYAAYKSDKLPDTHPAMKWLKKLFGEAVSA